MKKLVFIGIDDIKKRTFEAIRTDKVVKILVFIGINDMKKDD